MIDYVRELAFQMPTLLGIWFTTSPAMSNLVHLRENIYI